MKNSSRQIVKIIKEICKKYQIDLTLLFTEWVLQMVYMNQRMYITGYQFPNNSSASARLCDDKCALCSILTDHGIPSILHEYFMTPNNKYHIKVPDNINLIFDMLNKYGTIVCKINTGTSGNLVYKTSTKEEVLKAVQEIYSRSDLAVCPFYKFDNEYRIIVLNNKAELVYKKEIPYVTGDGVKTFNELCTEKITTLKLKDTPKEDTPPCLIEEYENYDENDIIPAGTNVYAGWKHNLALGASASIIKEQELINKLTPLALKAAKIIQIDFASVDIVEINNEFYVLEINSGIVMENFSLQSDENFNIAKGIYEKAIVSYFEIDTR